MNRIIIVGGVNTGKTSLALRLKTERNISTIRSTDSLIDLGWSEASAAAALWFSEPGDWIIEGVAVPRALRKWLAANPNARLDAEIITLHRPLKPLSKGQRAMTLGMHTVLREIAVSLKQRGAVFVAEHVKVATAV